MASELIQRDNVKVVSLKRLIENAGSYRETVCDFKTWYEGEGLTKESTGFMKEYDNEVHNDLSCGLKNFKKMETEPVKDHTKKTKINNMVKCLRSLPSKIPTRYEQVKAVSKFRNMASELSSALEAIKKYPYVMAVFFTKSSHNANRPSTGNQRAPSKMDRPFSAKSGSGPASVTNKTGDGANSHPESATKCQNCAILLKELERRRIKITHLEKTVRILTEESNEKSLQIADVETWAKALSNENKTLKNRCDKLEAEKVKLKECLDKIKSSKEQKTLMASLSSDKLLQTREKHMHEMEENFERELEYRDRKIQQMREEISSLTDRLSAEMSKKVSSDESAIENINIKHRPMTIAEDYYNFCSNAWLDAKMMLDETCPKEKEKDVLIFLNTVLEITSARTYAAFKDLFRSLDLQILHPGVLIQPGKVEAKSGTLPVEVSLVLGDYMRVTSGKADMSTLASDVKKMLQQQKPKFVKLLQDEVMSAYIQEACVIGWQMAIQRPPMEFRWDGVDKAWQEVLQEPYWRCDPYKEGATVKYYVHPSMHHGGAVLVKGKVYID